MKIVSLLRSNPKDSAFGKVLIALSKEYKINCYIWDRNNDFTPFFHHVNVRYEKYKLRSGYYNLKTLFKLIFFNFWLFLKLIASKTDYIHAIDLDTGIVGLSVAKMKNIPFVYQCLDPYYANLPVKWPKWLGDFACRLESWLITSSDLFLITDCLRMPQHPGANPKRIMEFANVPYDFPAMQKEIHGDFLVGYIGSLIEGRNLVDIINVVGELNILGIRLIIGGFGPLESTIQSESMKYNNVSYIGWVPYDDVLKLENTFDVIIHTTDPNNESQKWVSPNKLFESMALGKPIIVSEGTLSAKRVRIAGCGLVIKYGSKEELKEALLKLKNNQVLTEELGRRGGEEHSRKWKWARMEKELLETYHKMD